DVSEMAATLETLGTIDDKLVVKEVMRGLKSKEIAVQLATLTALRFNPNGAAITGLLKQKNNKSILDNVDLAEEYYYALGQHRHSKGIDILTDGLWSNARSSAVLRARVLSLGRIRDKDSCEALMGMLKSSGGRRNSKRPAMNEFRISMCVLTGQDAGGDTTAWIEWWNDEKKKLKISDEEWPLPTKNFQKNWDTLWATPEEKEAARKKERERRAGRGEGKEGEKEDQKEGKDSPPDESDPF
ncbi:MAG: hypothetical protein MK213_00685, partial [Planctomycetes bacterium]|nr:hypothetical protein [Planctomycetota bacterium]